MESQRRRERQAVISPTTPRRYSMTFYRNIVLLLLVILAGQAIAQNPKATADSARARLGFLVGSFVTETSMPPGPMAPKGASGTGTSVITRGLDSAFLLIDEQSVNSLFGAYKGHGVLGYDVHTNQYSLSMFNNFGDHPIYTGSFAGDTLVLLTKVPMPGRSFDQKVL
jgi:hypothetical protein